MLFLSRAEAGRWAEMGAEVLARRLRPGDFAPDVRANLVPVFHYFVGTRLIAGGHAEQGNAWLAAGALCEAEGQFSNGFLVGFLGRHGGRLEMPAVVFADPAPFVHWCGVPALREARARFLQQAGHTLPAFPRPFRFMDIGCGDGALTVKLLAHLRATGKVGDVAEVVLVDASAAMCELATRTVSTAFPGLQVTPVHSRIEAFSEHVEGRFDLVLASLSYHHLPYEAKLVHLERLRGRLDHFVLFELDANNDTPELGSPDLALSVYQSFGRIIDWVFAHDAPVEVAIDTVDNFLMSEAVSFLTQPRGLRTDYHMLRGQWHELFRAGLGDGFACGTDSVALADDAACLFTMHYGR